jgi:hypothetical protein
MRVPDTSVPPLMDIRLLGDAPFGTGREHSEAMSFIRHFLATADLAVTDLKTRAVMLKPLAAGRSAAHVFKLTIFSGSDHQVKGSPAVVKIMSRADGAREKTNYERFVRSMLPSVSRPELLGFVQTRDRSALCYSFVGGSDGMPVTLTDHLQRGDTTTLELFLCSIFEVMRDTWYSPHSIRPEQDIAQRYRDRYFTRMSGILETESTLFDCAARYFGLGQSGGRYMIGGISFPSPHAVLFATRHAFPYHSCILHGDLNTDNIVVASDQSNLSLVDFQKTGRGHVYEDLVALEASVRINYPPDVPIGDVFEIERRIALGWRQPPGDPYAASIRKIRDAAFGHFGSLESDATYHFAVAAIGLRLMQAVDLSHIARARITASALWAAKVLTGELPA